MRTKIITAEVNKEEFYEMYLKVMLALCKITSKSTLNIFIWLCKHSVDGKILLPLGIKKQMLEELQVSNNSVTNAIKILKARGLIEGDKGNYTMPKLLIWPDFLKDRAQFDINFNLTYDDI